ncbi:hypothetical protein FGB62_66g142 [Gracilaria domingensis]|nr:hypothetical protein FGB62_66g142 [Gracilaria domingensis]
MELGYPGCLPPFQRRRIHLVLALQGGAVGFVGNSEAGDPHLDYGIERDGQIVAPDAGEQLASTSFWIAMMRSQQGSAAFWKFGDDRASERVASNMGVPMNFLDSSPRSFEPQSVANVSCSRNSRACYDSVRPAALTATPVPEERELVAVHLRLAHGGGRVVDIPQPVHSGRGAQRAERPDHRAHVDRGRRAVPVARAARVGAHVPGQHGAHRAERDAEQHAVGDVRQHARRAAEGGGDHGPQDVGRVRRAVRAQGRGQRQHRGRGRAGGDGHFLRAAAAVRAGAAGVQRGGAPHVPDPHGPAQRGVARAAAAGADARPRRRRGRGRGRGRGHGRVRGRGRGRGPGVARARARRRRAARARQRGGAVGGRVGRRRARAANGAHVACAHARRAWRRQQ